MMDDNSFMSGEFHAFSSFKPFRTHPAEKAVDSSHCDMTSASSAAVPPSFESSGLSRANTGEWYVTSELVASLLLSDLCHVTGRYPGFLAWRWTLGRVVCEGSWDLNRSILRIASGILRYLFTQTSYVNAITKIPRAS